MAVDLSAFFPLGSAPFLNDNGVNAHLRLLQSLQRVYQTSPFPYLIRVRKDFATEQQIKGFDQIGLAIGILTNDHIRSWTELEMGFG